MFRIILIKVQLYQSGKLSKMFWIMLSSKGIMWIDIILLEPHFTFLLQKQLQNEMNNVWDIQGIIQYSLHKH